MYLHTQQLINEIAVDEPDPADGAGAEGDGAAPDPVRRVVITADVPAAKERPDLDDATLAHLRAADLDAPVPVPEEMPWYPPERL